MAKELIARLLPYSDWDKQKLLLAPQKEFVGVCPLLYK